MKTKSKDLDLTSSQLHLRNKMKTSEEGERAYLERELSLLLQMTVKLEEELKEIAEREE